MTTLTIAAAQSISIAGDVPANISRHLAFMRCAAEHSVQLLVFCELSLTGYEPSLAATLAVAPDDEVLAPLRAHACELGIAVVVGMPIRLAPHAPVLIGALALGPDGSLAVYSKQHLHPGEEAVFAPGTGGAALEWGADTVALAVCADFSHADHPRHAAAQGANIYAAGVLISEAGYEADTRLLQGYAIEHSMVVLMANHGGVSGGWACAGRSAIWAPDGRMIVAASGKGDSLVIARRDAGGWSGRQVPV